MSDSNQQVPFLMLHENPLYIMEQSQRYAHLSELSGQLQKVTKTLGHYTNLGYQLCDALQEIISSLNQIEFVCTNSTFEKLMGSMNDIQSSLRNHFQKVTNSSERVMKQFVKNEIPNLTELKKNHEKLLEKYSTSQEKYLSVSNKNQKLSSEKLNELDDVLRESTLTLYDYVSLIELDETKTEHLISQFLLNFPKSFVESIKNLKQLDDDYSEIYSKSTNSIKYYYNKKDENGDNNINDQSPVDTDFLKILNPDFESIEKSIKDNRIKVNNSIPNAIKRLHNHLPEQNANKIVSKQGYLYRKKKNSKKFSKKFFTCANGQLSYSKTVENAHNPSFSINLAIATVQKKGEPTQSISNANSGSNFNSNNVMSPGGSSNSDERPFLFKVVTPDVSLTLQALSTLDYDEWIAAIRNGILHALETGDLNSIPMKMPKHHHQRNESYKGSFDTNLPHSKDGKNFYTDEDDSDLMVITKRKPKAGYGSMKVKTRRMSLTNRSPLMKNPSPLHMSNKAISPVTPPPPQNMRNNNSQSPLFIPTPPSSDRANKSDNDAKATKSNSSLFSSTSFTSTTPCKCADCGAEIAEWIVANKALLICEKCAGCHRSLAGVSSVRSLKLDKLDPYILKLLEMFPGNSLNKVYEGVLTGPKKIRRGIDPLSNVQQRQEFIEKKYINHDFVKIQDKKRFIQINDDEDDDDSKDSDYSGDESSTKITDIFSLLQTQDIEGLMLYLFLGILKDDPNSSPNSFFTNKNFLPIHAASIIGNPISIAILILNDPNEINQLDTWGWSPLSYATFFSNKAAVEALLTYRASLSSSKAANPYKIASANKNNELIDMFTKVNSASGESLGLNDSTNYHSFIVSNDVKKNFSPGKNVNDEEFLQLHERAPFLKQELIRIQLNSQDQNQNQGQSPNQGQAQDPNLENQMTNEDKMAIQKAIFLMRKKGRKKSKTHYDE